VTTSDIDDERQNMVKLRAVSITPFYHLFTTAVMNLCVWRVRDWTRCNRTIAVCLRDLLSAMQASCIEDLEDRQAPLNAIQLSMPK
jgi:hypothetical protein